MGDCGIRCPEARPHKGRVCNAQALELPLYITVPADLALYAFQLWVLACILGVRRSHHDIDCHLPVLAADLARTSAEWRLGA